MSTIKKINWMYFITVVVLMIGSSIPIYKLTDSKMVLLLYSQLIIILPSLVYWFRTGQSYKELVGVRKIKLSTAALLVVFTFVMIPIMGFINTLSRFFAVDATTDTMVKVTEGNSFFVSLLVVAIVPAVFEESVYRGIFLKEYRKANPRVAIFLSAFLFAMLHGNFNQFTYALFMGIIFSLVIEATDSVVSTMIMHFIINGNSVVMMYLLPIINKVVSGKEQQVEELLDQAENITELGLLPTITMYGPQVAVCGVLGYLLLCAIAKSCNREDHMRQLFVRQYYDKPREKIVSLPLIIALAFLLCNMILVEVLSR